jgi:hypothetical protein
VTKPKCKWCKLHLATHTKRAKEYNDESMKPCTTKNKIKCRYDGAKDIQKKWMKTKWQQKKGKKIGRKFKKKYLKFFTQMKGLGLD